MIFFSKIKKNKRINNDKCTSLLNQLNEALSAHSTIFNNKLDFINVEATEQWKNDYQSLLSKLGSKELKKLKKTDNYLALQDNINKLNPIIQSLDHEREDHNASVSKLRASNVYSLIGKVEGNELDEQQLVAISKQVHNHLVIAGAGTGKTTTIVGLVKYLLKTGKYKSDEILVLSFTNKSASEMRERIHNETEQNIQAITFHKLGLNILSEVDKIKPDISNDRLTNLIKEQIKLLISDHKYLKKLNLYLVGTRINSKSEFEFKSKAEYDEYIKNNPPVTLNHERVKSYGEMEIANFLYMNGVSYKYEDSYKIDTRTEKFGQYHPDFYLPEYDLYLEYFGIDKNGQPPSYFQGDYVASMKWKRELHNTNNTTMIESYAYENFNGILITELEKKLLSNNVKLNPKDQATLWKEISESDPGIIDGIKKLFETVINLIKINRYTIEKVKTMNAHRGKLRQIDLLLDLIEPIWEKYNDELIKNKEVDFNDMINKATDYIRDGRYNNKYKMVIVDEYQDISKSRYEILKALRESNDYDVFCVGDDWQSIYRFAGSDIGFIQRFSDYWGPTEISKIETTYRFSQRLIDISSNFIMRNPKQIKKSIKGKYQYNGYVLGEKQGFNEIKAIEFMTEKLDDLPENSTVYMIGRYSFDKNLLEQCSDFSVWYDNKNEENIVCYKSRQDLIIKFLTVHKSKGLQADYVFILNNKSGRMGFPSEIQDSPVLDLLLEQKDKYPHAEERRLFYVALTRAKKKVILVTVKNKESCFVGEIKSCYGGEIEAEGYACPVCGGKLSKKKGPYGYFLGCSNYNKYGCRYKRKIKSSLK